MQYIMGVAPGILTEFYAQMNDDFCSDVQAWTTLLLNTSDIPLVHSVSYGWQGDLSEVGQERLVSGVVRESALPHANIPPQNSRLPLTLIARHTYDHQLSCTSDEVTAIDADFAQLAARGITLIVSR